MLKILGIIAFVAVIGFAFIACEEEVITTLKNEHRARTNCA